MYFFDAIGREYYTPAVYATTSDYNALTVAKCLHHDKDGCEMHYIDKIGKFATGDIFNKHGGIPVDDFAKCQAIL